MNNEIRFSAPWSLAVKIITVVAGGLLLGVSFIGSWHLPDSTPLFARLSVTLLPLVILVGTLPFIVRGETLWILAAAHASRMPEYWIERQLMLRTKPGSN